MQTFGVDIEDSVLDTILPYHDYYNSIYFRVNLVSTYQIGLQTIPGMNINISSSICTIQVLFFR